MVVKSDRSCTSIIFIIITTGVRKAPVEVDEKEKQVSIIPESQIASHSYPYTLTMPSPYGQEYVYNFLTIFLLCAKILQSGVTTRNP